MTSPLQALWATPPPVPPPPRRVWRDAPLVGAVGALAVLEAVLRPEVPFRWVWGGVLLILAPTLLWRRRRPLLMFAATLVVNTLVALFAGATPPLYTTAYVLILLYAVVRWGGGPALIIGPVLVVAGWLATFAYRTPQPADAIGGLVVVIATGSLGAAFRWRARARLRERDQTRLLERERLARDLHDTVAHHVSAIAIQAQAGTAVATADPAAAAAALRTIEAEASRALDEMRSMVGTLRGGDVDLSPLFRIGDLHRLADTALAGPAVHVRVAVPAALAEAAALSAVVSAAAFRIAQEAVTNARRHARAATRIDLDVSIRDGCLHLNVQDDGAPVSTTRPGYGITGMVERARLVGGTCRAAPDPNGGWRVTAVLPAGGATR